jgi:hypothetical protein
LRKRRKKKTVRRQAYYSNMVNFRTLLMKLLWCLFLLINDYFIAFIHAEFYIKFDSVLGSQLIWPLWNISHDYWSSSISNLIVENRKSILTWKVQKIVAYALLPDLIYHSLDIKFRYVCFCLHLISIQLFLHRKINDDIEERRNLTAFIHKIFFILFAVKVNRMSNTRQLKIADDIIPHHHHPRFLYIHFSLLK